MTFVHATTSPPSVRPLASLEKKAKFCGPFFVGIDVGGTNTKIGVVDNQGATLASGSLRTEGQLGPEVACERIANQMRRIIAEAGLALDDVARIGLATPGGTDLVRGTLLSPANLPLWWDFPLRERASYHLARPLTLTNDANAATFGEYWRGGGKRHQNFILLTLGTGIGGGIIHNGMLVRGSHNFGSECGYLVVNCLKDARRDALGIRGTLEAYASARALVERTHEFLDAGEASSLSGVSARGDAVTPEIIAAEAERGDRLAREVVMETACYLAAGIVSMIHAIDPDVVMIGGAMTFGGATSALGRDFLQCIRDEVRPRLLEPLRDVVAIEFASLGSDAGYIGAAGLARLEHVA
jgi:glucokinase